MLRPLNLLCTLAALLAALSLSAIAVIILAQIIARLLHFPLPSTDEFAAWAMAAAVFLALPTAFYHGSHIRVTLGLDRLPEAAGRGLLRAGNLLGLGVMAYASWATGLYVWESFIYDDRAQGVLALPLWIPQMSMWLGMVICLPVLAYLAVTGRTQCSDLPEGGTE